MRRTLLSLGVFLALLSTAPALAHADCSSLPDTHPAAANELPGVPEGTCVPNNSQQNGGLNGGCDFNPYPILEGFKTGGNVHITPSNNSGSLTDGINPALACRLAQFLQYARGVCPLQINSGYRSAQEQYNICGNGGHNCGTPGRSCHQYGLAADLTGAARCIAWAKQLFSSTSAPGAQQFKIFWPISSDDGHTQCIENTVGACSPSTQPCDGSVRITPNLSVIPAPGNGLPFDQQARSTLGVPPPPPPPPPAQPLQSLTQPSQTTNPATQAQNVPQLGTLNSTAYPAGTCVPQTYCSQQDGNIYYRASTCVDQLYQTCQSGCSGLTCTASSTNPNSALSGLLSPASSSQSTGGTTNDNTNSNGNGTSTFDLIDFFANQPTLSAANVGTATPIDITNAVQDTGNASVLQPGSGTPPKNPVIQTPPQGSAYGPVPQQTFTSPDLGGSPAGYLPAQNTFEQALAQMRATLIGIMQYLHPFGGIAPQSGPTE